MKLSTFILLLFGLVAVGSCGGPQLEVPTAEVAEASGVHQCKVTKDIQRPMLRGAREPSAVQVIA